MKRGALPTGIVSTTRLVCGSTRVDGAVLGARHPDGVLAEREPVRSRRDVDFRDDARWSPGSKRASVPLASVIIQTLPAPATIDPSELPIVGLDRGRRPRRSSRSTREHRLVAAVRHPQAAEAGGEAGAGRLADGDRGRRPVFVLGSMRDTLSFGLFETQTCSSIASQSGVPGTWKHGVGLEALDRDPDAGRLDAWSRRPRRLSWSAPATPSKQRGCRTFDHRRPVHNSSCMSVGR